MENQITTDKLKEIIEKSQYKPKGWFTSLMFVSNGIYNGFFGKNGYNKILILGFSDGNWYIVSDYGDCFYIFTTLMSFNLDIPTDYGVPRIWFDKPIYIDNSIDISTVIGEFEKEEKE